MKEYRLANPIGGGSHDRFHIAFYDSFGVRCAPFAFCTQVVYLSCSAGKRLGKFRINSLLDVVNVLFCAFFAVAGRGRLLIFPTKTVAA